MTWVLHETSDRIKQEIAEHRPLRWGTTRYILAAFLAVGTLGLLPVLWQQFPLGWFPITAPLLLIFAMNRILALADQGTWSSQTGFQQWRMRNRIGYTSVWMLRNERLELRIDPRDRRQTNKDTGKWVLDVPLGGPNPQPTILQAQTNNPYRGLTVAKVIWGEMGVERVIIRDLSGSCVPFNLEDLLSVLEDDTGWDLNQRIRWMVSKLVRDSRTLLERHKQYLDAADEVNRLKLQNDFLVRRGDGLGVNISQLERESQHWKEYLTDTTKRYWRLSVVLHETMCFLDGIRGTLVGAARLQQRAPKEVAQMRDELLTWKNTLMIEMRHIEKTTPKVMLISELPKS